MNLQWFAHSANRNARRHPASEHLESVARLARKFSNAVPWSGEAFLAGLFHDLGKYGDLFQDRLRGLESGLDHWSAGAWVALKNFHAVAAALAIQGHHVGLQRGDKSSLANLFRPCPPALRLTDNCPENLKRRAEEDGLRFEKPDGQCLDPANFLQKPCGSMLDVRLLYSCLVDADFLDTEAHFDGDENGKR